MTTMLYPKQDTDLSIVISLSYLPKAGCMAMPILLNDSYRYFAVVDTGSPFLTAPADANIFSQQSLWPSTKEQYGDIVGTVKWRRSNVKLPSAESFKKSLVLGVPDASLVDQTGGIFAGLMVDDLVRPTFLGQLDYSSFRMDYVSRTLTLSRVSSIAEKYHSFDMFDWNGYGPNIHNYGVLCDSVAFTTSSRSDPIIVNASRPVVVVIDTGLTGCILSESWLDDIDNPATITGATLRWNNVDLCLESDWLHWDLQCFKLPWFYKNKYHPHVIAAGATFLQDKSIAVDTVHRKLQILLTSTKN